MRDLIKMTDDQLDDFMEKVADETGLLGAGDDLTFTQETLDHWRGSSKGWRECGGSADLEIDGHKAVHFEGAQAFKGQRRRDIVVIDFGPARGVFEM